MVGAPHGNYWVSVRKKAKSSDGEPNWNLVYNAGEAPTGFEAAWNEIRGEYEKEFDVE
jgi:hypothetical protein